MNEKELNHISMLLRVLINSARNAKIVADMFKLIAGPDNKEKCPHFRYVELISGYNDEVFQHKNDKYRVRVHIHKSSAEIVLIKRPPKFNKVPYSIKKYYEPERTIQVQI